MDARALREVHWCENMTSAKLVDLLDSFLITLEAKTSGRTPIQTRLRTLEDARRVTGELRKRSRQERLF